MKIVSQNNLIYILNIFNSKKNKFFNINKFFLYTMNINFFYIIFNILIKKNNLRGVGN